MGGIAEMCLCETKYLGARGCITPFWGTAKLPEKSSALYGYRNDSITISCAMGPLSCDRYGVFTEDFQAHFSHTGGELLAGFP